MKIYCLFVFPQHSAVDAWGVVISLDFLENFSEHQILWNLCLVVFHALTLRLPIQTSLSVAHKLPVSLSFFSGKPAHPCVLSVVHVR